MKKVFLSISVIGILYSCQAPKADPAAIDAKMTEVYHAEKDKVVNDIATECESKINDKVKGIQDSMATMSAAEQAKFEAKQHASLKAAQLKNDVTKKKADAAKKLADAKKKAEAAKPKVGKPVLDDKGNQVGKAVERGASAPGGFTDEKIKVNEQGNQVGKPVER